MIGFTVAWAAEPVLDTTPSGAIHGRVELAAAPDVVRTLLRDSKARVAALGGSATVTVEVDGRCTLEHTAVAHPIKAVAYTARSCPTDTGVQTDLVKSADLATLRSVWTVTAGPGGGSIVDYELTAVPTFPLPGFIARASTKAGVADSLTALVAHFR